MIHTIAVADDHTANQFDLTKNPCPSLKPE